MVVPGRVGCDSHEFLLLGDRQLHWILAKGISPQNALRKRPFTNFYFFSPTFGLAPLFKKYYLKCPHVHVQYCNTILQIGSSSARVVGFYCNRRITVKKASLTIKQKNALIYTETTLKKMNFQNVQINETNRQVFNRFADKLIGLDGIVVLRLLVANAGEVNILHYNKEISRNHNSYIS